MQCSLYHELKSQKSREEEAASMLTSEIGSVRSRTGRHSQSAAPRTCRDDNVPAESARTSGQRTPRWAMPDPAATLIEYSFAIHSSPCLPTSPEGSPKPSGRNTGHGCRPDAAVRERQRTDLIASRVREGIATRFYQFRVGKVKTNEICSVSSRELESGGRSA
jgi:hypothetical protein